MEGQGIAGLRGRGNGKPRACRREGATPGERCHAKDAKAAEAKNAKDAEDAKDAEVEKDAKDADPKSAEDAEVCAFGYGKSGDPALRGPPHGAGTGRWLRCWMKTTSCIGLGKTAGVLLAGLALAAAETGAEETRAPDTSVPAGATAGGAPKGGATASAVERAAAEHGRDPAKPPEAYMHRWTPGAAPGGTFSTGVAPVAPAEPRADAAKPAGNTDVPPVDTLKPQAPAPTSRRVDRLSLALREDKTLRAYADDVLLERMGDALILRGTVPTEEVKEAVETKAKAYSEGLTVRTELKVGTGPKERTK